MKEMYNEQRLEARGAQVANAQFRFTGGSVLFA